MYAPNRIMLGEAPDGTHRRPSHLSAIAFVDILLLAAIVGTLILFWKVERPAGALLVPYLAWVGFASALNFTVWQLNRSALG